MILGCSTSRFWPFERDLTKVLSVISEHVRVAEIWLEPPFYPSWRTSREKADLDMLTDILVVTELDTTVHAPYHELGLCSWNNAVCALTVKEVLKSLDMAEEINASTVTFHAGLPRLSDGECAGILRRNLEALNDLAEGYSAKLCLENASHGVFSDVERMLELTCGLKNIYYTMDLAHLSIHGKDLREHRKALKGKIRNAHVSCISKDGRHAPLTRENECVRNSLKVLKSMKYPGAVILEGSIKGRPGEVIPKEIETYRRMLR